MEENIQHFWHILLCYFKKGKNATGLQEKMCAMYGEGAVTDRMCQKWFVKFLGSIDVLTNNSSLWGCLMHWKMFSSTPGLYHWKPIAGDRQHTQNIQINKVIGENEKCVFYFTEKLDFWPN